MLRELDRIAQLGLVVFVFLLGCELRTDRIERKGVMAAAVVGGMALPCAAGAGIVLATGDLLTGPTTTPVRSMLFVGLTVAVTALPVLARIVADLGLARTDIGALSLSVAATGDGVLWLTLAFLLAGRDEAGHGTRIVLLATVLVLVTVLCVRPLLALLVRKLGRADPCRWCWSRVRSAAPR